MSKSVKTVLFASKGETGIYASTNGKMRYCTNGSLWDDGRRGAWISVPSIPSTAKRLCVVNNFKEKHHA